MPKIIDWKYTGTKQGGNPPDAGSAFVDGIGIKTGHLSRRADGAIVGKSNPLDWFDAVDARRKET